MNVQLQGLPARARVPHRGPTRQGASLSPLPRVHAARDGPSGGGEAQDPASSIPGAVSAESWGKTRDEGGFADDATPVAPGLPPATVSPSSTARKEPPRPRPRPPPPVNPAPSTEGVAGLPADLFPSPRVAVGRGDGPWEPTPDTPPTPPASTPPTTPRTPRAMPAGPSPTAELFRAIGALVGEGLQGALRGAAATAYEGPAPGQPPAQTQPPQAPAPAPQSPRSTVAAPPSPRGTQPGAPASQAQARPPPPAPAPPAEARAPATQPHKDPSASLPRPVNGAPTTLGPSAPPVAGPSSSAPPSAAPPSAAPAQPPRVPPAESQARRGTAPPTPPSQAPSPDPRGASTTGDAFQGFQYRGTATPGQPRPPQPRPPQPAAPSAVSSPARNGVPGATPPAPAEVRPAPAPQPPTQPLRMREEPPAVPRTPAAASARDGPRPRPDPATRAPPGRVEQPGVAPVRGDPMQPTVGATLLGMAVDLLGGGRAAPTGGAPAARAAPAASTAPAGSAARVDTTAPPPRLDAAARDAASWPRPPPSSAPQASPPPQPRQPTQPPQAVQPRQTSPSSPPTPASAPGPGPALPGDEFVRMRGGDQRAQPGQAPRRPDPIRWRPSEGDVAALTEGLRRARTGGVSPTRRDAPPTRQDAPPAAPPPPAPRPGPSSSSPALPRAPPPGLRGDGRASDREDALFTAARFLIDGVAAALGPIPQEGQRDGERRATPPAPTVERSAGTSFMPGDEFRPSGPSSSVAPSRRPSTGLPTRPSSAPPVVPPTAPPMAAPPPAAPPTAASMPPPVAAPAPAAWPTPPPVAPPVPSTPPPPTATPPPAPAWAVAPTQGGQWVWVPVQGQPPLLQPPPMLPPPQPWAPWAAEGAPPPPAPPAASQGLGYPWPGPWPGAWSDGVAPPTQGTPGDWVVGGRRVPERGPWTARPPPEDGPWRATGPPRGARPGAGAAPQRPAQRPAQRPMHAPPPRQSPWRGAGGAAGDAPRGPSGWRQAREAEAAPAWDAWAWERDGEWADGGAGAAWDPPQPGRAPGPPPPGWGPGAGSRDAQGWGIGRGWRAEDGPGSSWEELGAWERLGRGGSGPRQEPMPQGQFPMGGAPSGYGDPRGRREERPGPPPPRRWAERDPPPRSAPHQPLGRGGRVLPPPAHAADASRRYVSLLGPSERPTTVVEYPGELWVFTQPWELAAHDLCVRMAVHRLPDGSLWVWSPVALTEEVIAHLDAIGGRVAHIVLPALSPEHSVFAPAYAERWPMADVWAVPELLRPPLTPPRVARLLRPGRVRLLAHGRSPPEWGGAIDLSLLSAPGAYEEATALVRAARCALVADALVQASGQWLRVRLSDGLQELWGRGVAWAGVGGQPGELLARMVGAWDPEAVRVWAARVLSWDFDMMVPAHMDSPIWDARAQFEAAVRGYWEAPGPAAAAAAEIPARARGALPPPAPLPLPQPGGSRGAGVAVPGPHAPRGLGPAARGGVSAPRRDILDGFVREDVPRWETGRTGSVPTAGGGVQALPEAALPEAAVEHDPNPPGPPLPAPVAPPALPASSAPPAAARPAARPGRTPPRIGVLVTPPPAVQADVISFDDEDDDGKRSEGLNGGVLN